MSTGIIANIVAPHTPRIGIEAKAPEFAKGLIGGLRELGEKVRALKPDLVVLLSSHWVSTFNWYVTTHARHKGVCIADEAPDLIPGIEYDYPGAPEFAKALGEALNAGGVPTGFTDSPHFNWDYGSLVPLQYMDPKAELPVVLMPSVICSDLDECRKVGQTVFKTARKLGKRVVFVASCALSHEVRRGPDLWPLDVHKAMDQRFMTLMAEAKVKELAAWGHQFCKEAVAEMGGKPVSAMIGAGVAMVEAGMTLSGGQYGPYGQSSGSGNVSLALFAQGA